GTSAALAVVPALMRGRDTSRSTKETDRYIVLFSMSARTAGPFVRCDQWWARATVTAPVTTKAATVHGRVLRMMMPSLPLIPAVDAPMTMLAGAIALPSAPPADCAARIVETGSPLIWATFTCRSENRTFDELDEEVANAPTAPMPFARNAYTAAGVTADRPRASVCVWPA